ATPSDMSGIYLRGRGDQLVQLGALARVEEGVGPRQINHFNRVPSFTLSASLNPGFAQGEALDSLDRLARRVLPPGSTTALAGDSREFRESGGALYVAFGGAVLRGVMLLAAVVEAGRIRLRPILMTSVATIMGAIPVMIGVGAGSASRRPLGYAIVGGIFFSTALTLFVVPVGYVLLDRLTARQASRVRVARRPVEAD